MKFAVDLNEYLNEFDKEDVYVGFVPLTFMNEGNIPLVRTNRVPKQLFVCTSVTSFINMNISTKNSLDLVVSC